MVNLGLIMPCACLIYSIMVICSLSLYSTKVSSVKVENGVQIQEETDIKNSNTDNRRDDCNNIACIYHYEYTYYNFYGYLLGV